MRIYFAVFTRGRYKPQVSRSAFILPSQSQPGRFSAKMANGGFELKGGFDLI